MVFIFVFGLAIGNRFAVCSRFSSFCSFRSLGLLLMFAFTEVTLQFIEGGGGGGGGGGMAGLFTVKLGILNDGNGGGGGGGGGGGID